MIVIDKIYIVVIPKEKNLKTVKWRWTFKKLFEIKEDLNTRTEKVHTVFQEKWTQSSHHQNLSLYRSLNLQYIHPLISTQGSRTTPAPWRYQVLHIKWQNTEYSGPSVSVVPQPWIQPTVDRISMDTEGQGQLCSSDLRPHSPHAMMTSFPGWGTQPRHQT